jgi:hypothetical protein
MNLIRGGPDLTYSSLHVRRRLEVPMALASVLAYFTIWVCRLPIWLWLTLILVAPVLVLVGYVRFAPRKIWGSRPATGRALCLVDRDVVASEEEIKGSTYLETKSSGQELVKDCASNGEPSRHREARQWQVAALSSSAGGATIAANSAEAFVPVAGLLDSAVPCRGPDSKAGFSLGMQRRVAEEAARGRSATPWRGW